MTAIRERCLWLIGHTALVVEAWGLALFVEVALRAMPFSAVLARLARPVKPGTPVAIRAADAQRAVRMAYAALPFGQTCLRESLILCLMYRRRHQDIELRIGVQKEGEVFRSHAWVVDTRGTPVTDSLGFLPLSLPGPRDRQPAA